MSKDDTLNMRITQTLMKKRISEGTPSDEDFEKYLKLSNQMNTNELADVFEGRVEKLLLAVKADREKEEAKKAVAKNNSSSHGGKGNNNQSYIT